MNTKTLISTLLLMLSVSAFAQTRDNPEICKSSDKALSAEKVECFPDDNIMVIHEPKFRYIDQELNLLDWYGRSTSEQAIRICAAFGSEELISNPETEYYSFYSYLKEGVMYHGKQKYNLYSQTKYVPIKKITCNLVLAGRRAQLDDDGFRKCFDFNPDGTRGELQPGDGFCTYDRQWRINHKEVLGCYDVDFKGNAFGKRRSNDRCKGKTIDQNLKADIHLE